MAWTTATLAEKTRREGALTLRIVYGRDDTAETAIEQVTVTTVPDVPAIARATLARLNAIEQAATALALGAIDLTPPVVPAPKPPPPKDLEREAFLLDYRLLQQLQAAVKAGIKSETDPDVVAQVLKVKAALKPEFVPSL